MASSSNSTGLLLLAAGAAGLVLMSRTSKASAANPPTPQPEPGGGGGGGGGGSTTTPAPREEEWGDPGGGGGGGGGSSAPTPSTPSTNDDGGGAASDDGGAAQEQGDTSTPDTPGERTLDQLDPRERAEAIAAARMAAQQEAALQAKAAKDAALKASALKVIANLKAKGTAYDRALLKAFQAAAGIGPDGLYGPETKGALQRYSGVTAPASLTNAAPARGPLQSSTPDPVVPGSAAAKAQSGTVTAPFVSMPAERASASAPSSSAKALATAVVANLKAKGNQYDRKALAAFQSAAGIAADGLYGPGTKAALDKYAPGAPPVVFKAASASAAAAPKPKAAPKPAASAPKPAAAPTATAAPKSAAKPVTVSPSTSKVDLAKARGMAVSVAGNLRNKGKAGYDRKSLAAFQSAAGITADGLYGPLAAAALKWFGANAPAPFLKGSVTSYTPPAAA
jgi:peptidoglycan hydrolase-like protein with peptidoglycan-binding domain